MIKPIGAFLLLIVLALVAGVVLGIVGAAGGLGLNLTLLIAMSVATVILMAGALWVGALWMRNIDEAAREAHKSAWYWGGTAGMAVGGVGVVLSRLPQAATIQIPTIGDPTPATYAAMGAVMMLGLMLLGYTIVWAWWWWARR
ncbi:hypothetical protein [Brevundimonas sp. PAMC22021]|uniref:hypothetical protein n=1 Tax=Brevundimonas sp. PAMC22021 TaxID=2861285 RepID=UPI001C634688|nr:hypothetical protein [Brevundimonas sp. PAMC22021]QYF86299.1 hypothetical protein KY493_10690 [Brevundimonas sp. PAMC22021]